MGRVTFMPTAERIAILTPHDPTARTGGVEVFCRQIQEVLGPARLFVAREVGGSAARFLARLGLLDPYRAAMGARQFLAAHARSPFDLVLSNGLYGWPLRLGRPEAPMIQVYHFTLAGLARVALPLRGDQLTTGRVGAWFERASGIGKEIVSVSPSVRSEVARYYGRPSTVVPNAVDVQLFRPVDRRDAREQLGLPQDRTIGLFVGRPEHAKGFDLLCEVAGRLRDTVFVSASPPASAPGNVRFLTKVPHEKMPLLYSAADFFLAPSRYEGFNLSLLEALACELPAVATRAACAFGEDPSEFVTLVERGTAEEFLGAIRRASNEGARPAVRERVVERYSWDAFRRNWQRLAATVMKRAAA